MNSVGYYVQSSEARQTIDAALQLIPKDASVAAGTFLVPALSDHNQLYELETTKQETEYIAVDLRFPERVPDGQYPADGSYETVYYAEGVIAVYRQMDREP